MTKEKKQFEQQFLSEWVDHRPILVVAGRRSEFTGYMESLARDAKAIVRKSSKWELDGQPFYFVSRVNQMRGIRAEEVHYIGTYFTLPEYDAIKAYEPVCTRQ